MREVQPCVSITSEAWLGREEGRKERGKGERRRRCEGGEEREEGGRWQGGRERQSERDREGRREVDKGKR